MPGRTPTEAYFELIDPIQEALNHIIVGRLILGREFRGAHSQSPEVVILNNGDPALLKSSLAGDLYVTVGLRVKTSRIDLGRNAFDSHIVGYWYTLSSSDDRELIAFHWTPDAAPPQRPFPHVHMGSALTGRSHIAGGDLNKLHIPTGLITVAAFVRFLIEELEVRVRPNFDRQAVLTNLNRMANKS
jgi:hypothetical protein